MPWLAGNAINLIQAGGLEAMSEAARWLAMVFAAIVASWLLHGPGRILERNAALKVRERLSALLVGRLLAAPLAWHERHHSGETTHRVQQSTGALYDFAQSQFIYLQNTVRLVGPIVALWLISPLVGAVAMVGYGLIGLLITRFDRVMMRIAVDENRAERAYSATLVDVLGNVLSVLALRRGAGVARLIGERLVAVFGPLKKSIVLNEAKWCSVDLLASALWCVLVGVYAAEAAGVFGFGATAAGGVAAAAGTIALGKVFMVYEYSQQAGGVITAIAAHFQSLARQRANYAAAEPLLCRGADRRRVPPTDEDIAAPPWQTLALEGVRFAHGDARAATLKLDRLELVRGRRYALVGPSGGGKTTLLRLLAGLDAPTARAPAARWPVREADMPARLRTLATLIPQQAEMFDGTLAENLLLGETAPVRAHRRRGAYGLRRHRGRWSARAAADPGGGGRRQLVGRPAPAPGAGARRARRRGHEPAAARRAHQQPRSRDRGAGVSAPVRAFRRRGAGVLGAPAAPARPLRRGHPDARRAHRGGRPRLGAGADLGAVPRAARRAGGERRGEGGGPLRLLRPSPRSGRGALRRSCASATARRRARRRG